MKKFVNVMWKLIFLAFWMPMYKVVLDIFTEPVTGLFIVAGMNDAGIAFWTATPWILPIIIIVMLIVDLTKSDKPEGGSGLNIPRG